MPLLSAKLPTSVRLDASTICQLRCAGCYMRNENHGLGAGCLKLADFEKFVRMNPHVKRIELSNNGEIFMNPDLAGIIGAGHRAGVALSAYNGVNFNDVSDDVMRAMVEFGFEGLTISIDGSSQKTYSRYRRGGNFKKVIANIKRLNKYKSAYGRRAPHLDWQYIIMESTDDEAEIKRAKKMAVELDMGIFFKKDWGGYAPKDPAMVARECNLRYDAAEPWVPCADLWSQPCVNWNGKLVGCCCSTNEFPLNCFEAGLDVIMSDKILMKTKKMLMGRSFCWESPCCNCWYFIDRILRRREFVKKEDFDDGR